MSFRKISLVSALRMDERRTKMRSRESIHAGKMRKRTKGRS